MYISIEDNEAFLVQEEDETNFYINGAIGYDPRYPIGHMVPVHTKKPGKIESIGKMGLHDTGMRIQELIEQGVEIR